MIIALDTETTGIDPWHGSLPFMVNIAYGDDTIAPWEWYVNPKTRQPEVPQEDIEEIQEALDQCDCVVMQNSKFDVRMLSRIGVEVDWSKVRDTLLQAHMLNSVLPKDLTSLALMYLKTDIAPFEDRLEKETLAARREAKKLGWRIAKAGLPEMPSAKEKTWKYDMWVVRQIAEEQGLPEDHPWHHVVREYAYTDPVVTLHLYERMKQLIVDKGLWEIYLWRLKQPKIIYDMEEVGVTYNEKRLQELIKEYAQASKDCGSVCTRVAQSLGFDLQLPKSGNNSSLLKFAFDVLKLPVIAKSKKTGNPSLDKNVLAEYSATLPTKSRQYRFAANLAAKRKRDTAIGYMESYARYALDEGRRTMRLHPSVNLTGTKTLRNSSKNPNEQNISKQEGFNLRYAFGPAPGREWWALDYDNLELRIPAYECQEPAMLELFEHPDQPPFFGSYHLLIFSILYPNEFGKYGVEVKSKYKSTLYQWTKNGNFAELYGAVDTGDGKSTADRAFHYPGAQAIVASKLKRKAELNRKWIAFANKHGYVTTLPDKSVDPDQGYQITCPRSPWGGISPTIPLNYHVQGTACWVKMQAMIKCAQALYEWNQRVKKDLLRFGYHIVMEVHDEIVFDFPYKPNKGNLPKINKVRRLMESCGDDIGIPLTCGVDYHPNNWSVAC